MTGDKRTYVRIELLREDQLPDLELARTFPQGSLDAQAPGKDLLTLLGIHKNSPSHFVRFSHESGRSSRGATLWMSANSTPQLRQHG